MILREALHKISHRENLTADEAHDVMDTIMDGTASPVQIAALLMALKVKGETTDELIGFVASLRHHAVAVKILDKNAVDGCGTGGDGQHTFNISTAASVIAASAGCTVAKHGNRAVSSRCGSADLLETTGANIDPGPDKVERAINELGFGFMFAPRFHPSMRHASEPRRELGVRTIFNVLGPLCNPGGVKRQVIGVYDKALMPLLIETLAAGGALHILVVHSRDGLDEFSISAPTDMMELVDGRILERSLTPSEAGIAEHPEGVLGGGDAPQNCAIFREVLAGRADGYLDASVLNAGALLYVAGKVESIREGVVLARSAVTSGATTELVDQWVKSTIE